METLESVLQRRSVRHFSSRDVDDAMIMKILDIARHAPSAMNAQPWRFMVIRNRNTLEKLANVEWWSKPIGRAPVAIAILSNPEESLMPLEDGVIVADHITLIARDMGLGTCWIGLFNRDDVKEILGVPKDWLVITVMPIGYPSERGWPPPRGRKPLEELLIPEPEG
jgi:nitroreductase